MRKVTIWKFTYAVLIVFFLVAVVAPVTGFSVAIYYYKTQASDFCEKIRENDSMEDIRTKANLLNYEVIEIVDPDGTATFHIPTQRSPYFRTECFISFKNGIITKTGVFE